MSTDRYTVLICGGRDWTEPTPIDSVLRQLQALHGAALHVIHGAAPGADALADDLCTALGISATAYPADWRSHGKQAGPIRNQRMLDEGKPNLVLAYPTPTSKGTWDMVRRARRAGVIVHVYKEGGYECV